MSDFSSSNTSNGGLYELGYTLEGVEPSYEVSEEADYEEGELTEHMRFVDEDELTLNMMFVSKKGMVLNADIVFPEEQRSKLAQYFREIADMLERKK